MTEEHRRSREIIFSRIEAHPGISNQELSALLGWTINRVTPRTRELLDEGQINLHVPRNTAELARQYIAISLMYGDLYRKAEALAYEIGEGTDTKAKLKEIIDKHNRRMEGRA